MITSVAPVGDPCKETRINITNVHSAPEARVVMVVAMDDAEDS